MKVLSGVYGYGTYTGDIVLNGEVCQFNDIQQSEKAGIAIIHQELAGDGDVIYGDQNVQGGNLKHLMIDSSAVDRLTFLIVRISATEYHTYTYVSADVSGGLPGQSRVHVYRTVMKKGDNGVWSAPASYEGYATVSAPGIVYRAIVYRTWTNHV